jgi:RHS repeat-associated protein
MSLRLRPAQVATVAQDFAARALAEAFALRHVAVEPHADPRFLRLRDPDGSVGAVGLDDRGRIASHRHPSGRQVSMQYSEGHQLTRIQLPSGLLTNLEYDGQDRLSRLNRGGLFWQLHYTDTAQIAGVTYPDQTRETFERSDEGRLIGHSDRRRHSTRFVWNDQRLEQIVDANGHATVFGYGAWERPDSLTRPDGTLEELVRDGAGLPSEARVDGERLAQLKLEGDQLTAISYADGEALFFAYDAQGRLTEGSSADVKVTRAYSDDGRLIREQIGDQVVEATYAFDGQLASIVTDGAQVHFEYDGDRRLRRIEDWQGGQQHYHYDNADREVVRTVPGLQETSTLSPEGLVAQVVTRTTPSGELRAWRQVAHDVNDRVVSVNDSQGGRTDYQYDADGQLLTAANPGGGEYFAYDPNGNRVAFNQTTATFDNVNALRTLGAERLSYDNRGNLLEREGPSGTSSYTFNARNLLAALTRADGVRIEFRYDAFGRRIAKQVGTTVTRYMWFGNHMLYEWRDGVTDSRTDYLYKPGTHEPLAMRRGGAIYYFHNGHDGAPRRLSDASGHFVWTATYSAFGELARSEGDVYQPLRFAGHFADAETGLYYNQARYYAPDLGRYISRDPLEFVSGPNAYLYCNNDPIGGRDPTGLLGGFWKAVIAATIVTVGIIAIVAAAPVVLAAAGAVAAGTAIAAGTASTVAVGIGGAFLVGAGVGLALAPDGCAKCQSRMMLEGGIAMAGAALTLASMIIFPPLAGGGAMWALAGGGTVGTGSAVGLAGAGAGVLGILGGGILQMGSKDDGGANSDESQATEPEKKQGDHVFAKGAQKLGNELRTAGKNAELPENVKGRIGQAAKDVEEALSDPALSRTVNKGPGPAGGDAQSKAFGDAVQQQRAATRDFLKAAEDAATAPGAQQAEAQNALRQAGNNLKSANQNVLRNVEDTQASRLANDPKTIESGRAAIEKAGQAQDSMVDDVIKMLETQP